MKTTILYSVISAALIGLFVWLISKALHFSFQEWAFFIGLGITTVLLFFNSSGGLHTRWTNFGYSITHGRQQEEDWKIDVGVLFYGSLIFTTASLVLMVIAYWSYF
ncbi:hypothetical protein MUN89_06710 [Halobacillus salinarum]|uniref:DUF3899 domain-containing protein n=1 Tax=Halobacillus salinarum TaxID=2932257 RepID=A0ABY4EME5_9BACI|nr:hypothetical protein [Halobacillus salinarum]UOQ45621.1 hypothetical protein MUN89_06710 [Halobacillus salinarum]